MASLMSLVLTLVSLDVADDERGVSAKDSAEKFEKTEAPVPKAEVPKKTRREILLRCLAAFGYRLGFTH